jgi:hypothetical protein
MYLQIRELPYACSSLVPGLESIALGDAIAVSEGSSRLVLMPLSCVKDRIMQPYERKQRAHPRPHDRFRQEWC